MLLWTVFVVLTLVAVIAVLWPLLQRSRVALSRQDFDLAIYKDQLREVERDLERGVIGESEAKAARTEISRKIIHLGDNEAGAQAPGVKSVGFNRAVGVGVFALIFGAAFGAYAIIGAPGLPGKPFAERISDKNKNPSLDELVARVEVHLRKNPGDARGWAIIAPSYMRLGRYNDAANALQQVMRLEEKPDPDVLSSYGEALVMANRGAVGEDAVKVFKEAVRLNPRQATPQYYLGLAELQAGRKDAAVAYWVKLLKNAPQNAPWRSQIEADIRKAGGTPPAAPAPAAGEAASGDGVPDIGQMIKNLAARLEEDGNNLDGWLMLARSYMVQKKNSDARSALDKAAARFKTDEKALEKINAARKAYGFKTPDAASSDKAPANGIPDIGKMVSGLAARLEKDGKDLKGWLMLARSYMVQKRSSDAKAALDKAAGHFKTDAKALEKIKAARKSLGL